MTNTYNWVTPSGNQVSATITVTHVTRDIDYADGWNIEVNSDYWRRNVDKLTVNGKETRLRDLDNFAQCILIDRVGKDRIMVKLPQDVIDAIYGDERRNNERKLEIAIKNEREYQAHVNAVLEMMNP